LIANSPEFKALARLRRFGIPGRTLTDPFAGEASGPTLTCVQPVYETSSAGLSTSTYWGDVALQAARHDRRRGMSVSSEPPAHGATLTRRRRVLVWALIAVASLLALVSILTIWVDRQMLDNHAWKNASTQVIQTPSVKTALSTYLVNGLYDNVDVRQALEADLPPNLKHLAGPLATALRQPATNAAASLLSRPRVQQGWIAATTLAHEKLVNVLENKTGHGISSGNGVVTVNLHGLVTQVGGNLGLSPSVLQKVPANAGVITVLRSDQLAAAQKGVRVVKILSAWLLVLVLGLFALAVYLARGARREALLHVGWAFVAVGVVVLIIRRVVGNYAIDALVSPGSRATLHDVWSIGTSILGQVGAAAILYGLLTVAGAALAGPSSVATALRRRIAPVLNQRPGIAALSLGMVYLLLVLWGPTHALREWWGILLLGGLLALGFLALRRQTRSEFVIERAAEATSARTSRESAAASVPRAESSRAPAATPDVSAAEEISRLSVLHDSGVISDDEFARAKRLALS
jgi:hypothetical protein